MRCYKCGKECSDGVWAKIPWEKGRGADDALVCKECAKKLAEAK